MEKLALNNNNLRKFGITISICCLLLIPIILLLRHKLIMLPFTLTAAAFFTAAVISPRILKPVYVIWMRLAFVLGWFNSRLILIVLFYLVFTPMGLLMKLFGKDLLELKIERQKDSYWKRKEKPEFNSAQYERLF